MDVKQAFAELGLSLHTNHAGRAAPVADPAGNARTRGTLVERTLQVSLFEAAFGCVKRVTGTERATCMRCAGSGEHAGTWTLGCKCLQCFGRGLHAEQCGAGSVGKVVRCEACTGSGLFQAAPPPCPACKGKGQAEHRAWVVDVQIHAGTLDGSEVASHDIRVCAASHQSARNFRIKVQVQKHPLFKLDQDRLSVIVPISVLRWSLGAELEVPTLDGRLRVPLPARPAAFWIRDQGWPQFGKPDQRKPLFVVPKMVYPEKLDAEGQRLLQALDARCKLPEVEGWNRCVQAWVGSA